MKEVVIKEVVKLKYGANREINIRSVPFGGVAQDRGFDICEEL